MTARRSAGKDNAGVSCTSPIAKAVTERTACDASSLSRAVAFLAAASLAAVASL